MERAAPYSTLEPAGDGDAAGSIAPCPPLPPLPLAMPVKPILFDLAFNGVAYPESVVAAGKAASAAAPAAKGAAPPAPQGGGGGGLLSWITGK